MPSLPSGDAEHLLKKISLWDFETPQVKLGDLATKFEVQAKYKDIQNWGVRGFLKPLRRGIKQDFMYSLKEVIKAVAISHLFPANPLKLADDIASWIAQHAGSLIVGGYDFLKMWEENKLKLYFYEVKEANFASGHFFSNEELASRIINDKFGINTHIFRAEECIFWTLCRYADWRYEHPIEDLLGCDERGMPRDPNHPFYTEKSCGKK
ncbi:hypothetical protein DSECCO2_565010 [anaerobic digester metagenome]